MEIVAAVPLSSLFRENPMRTRARNFPVLRGVRIGEHTYVELKKN